MASSRADDVLQLLASAADMDYIGEGVSQLQHALQAARAARLRGEFLTLQSAIYRMVTTSRQVIMTYMVMAGGVPV